MTIDHRAYAKVLRSQAVGPYGLTSVSLRQAVAEQVEGGPNAAPPYAALATQIATAAYRVADAQVVAVRDITGSDKATFEIVVTAATSAGLLRFDAAMRALEGVSDAAR